MPRKLGGQAATDAKALNDGDRDGMMGQLKANAADRARRKVDAGDRPEYTGPSIDIEKFRFKDSEAREKKKEREREQEEERDRAAVELLR